METTNSTTNANTAKERPAPRPALGKGLASLFPAPPAATAVAHEVAEAAAGALANKDRHMGIMMCAVEDIVPNQFQPRREFDEATVEELAQSIRENGLIQPLVVRKGAKGFQLIAGERRLRAAKLAGLRQVPIVIRRSTDQEALELALIENIQREDLNCMDTAHAYQQLMSEFSMTQEAVSQKVGKDRATVANHLRLLRLPEKIRAWLKEGTISYGHGKTLAGLMDHPADAERFAEEAIDLRWSVRELEHRIQAWKDGRVESPETPVAEGLTPVALRLQNVSKELSQKYSTKVVVKGHDRRGKIVLDYYSVDDLHRLIDMLGR